MTPPQGQAKSYWLSWERHPDLPAPIPPAVHAGRHLTPLRYDLALLFMFQWGPGTRVMEEDPAVQGTVQTQNNRTVPALQSSLPCCPADAAHKGRKQSTGIEMEANFL